MGGEGADFQEMRLGKGCTMVSEGHTGSSRTHQVTLRELKRKLITANKILELEKLATPFGHVSARIPGTETFLITRNIAPGMATPADIIACDLNGNVLEGKYKETYAEVAMHTGVYRKRKDVNSVVHTHSSYVASLSILRIASALLFMQHGAQKLFGFLARTQATSHPPLKL
jgi:ribulose-5-phosphate 4-epimerase/fuculose-1-phosphate aldolase